MTAPRKELTQHEIDTIKNNTAKAASKILGVHTNTIYLWCRKNNITPVWVREAASLRGWGEQYHGIRDKWAAGGMSFQELSEEYSLQPCGISQHLAIPTPKGAAKYLTKRELDWVKGSCPEGMKVDEYIASFVRDAYMEEAL